MLKLDAFAFANTNEKKNKIKISLVQHWLEVTAQQNKKKLREKCLRWIIKYIRSLQQCEYRIKYNDDDEEKKGGVEALEDNV